MNIYKVYKVLLSIIIFLSSCEKTPGEGGRASIIGSVEVERRVVISNPETSQDTIPSSDTEVFIVYGDNTSPDDRVFTNPDGDFAFNWLRTGDYTIYVYSEDTSEVAYPIPEFAVYNEVVIDGRKDVVDAGLITIYDEL